MNYNKKTVTDIDVKGKKVLCRCDFNVPQDKKTGAITDDKRIRAALPTLQYLLDQGAAVIACSHLGKPKGEVKPELSLAPVAKRLEELLGKSVIFASDVVGEDAKAKAAALQPGQIMLLENCLLYTSQAGPECSGRGREHFCRQKEEAQEETRSAQAHPGAGHARRSAAPADPGEKEEKALPPQ